jgi:hypothetical protein
MRALTCVALLVGTIASAAFGQGERRTYIVSIRRSSAVGVPAGPSLRALARASLRMTCG